MKNIVTIILTLTIGIFLLSGCSGKSNNTDNNDTNGTDTTAPIITLNGDAVVSVTEGSTYTDAGASATDNVDGDLTANIVTVNPVDTTTIGTYTVTYDVTDSSGNAATQVTRTVNVTVDTAMPSCGTGTDMGKSVAVSINGKTIQKTQEGAEVRIWHYPNGDKLGCMITGEATLISN